MATPGTKRARRAVSSKRRQRILDIAAEVIAKRGFANATVREIGNEAGILSGSLYQHFESKDAMLAEILGQLLDELSSAYRAVVEESDGPVEQFPGLVRCGYELVGQHRIGMTILHNDFSYISDMPDFAFVNKFNDELAEVWQTVLRDGVDAGVFRSDINIFLTYREVMGSLLAAVRWYNPKGHISPDEVADHQTALYYRGILQCADPAHANAGKTGKLAIG